MKESGLIVKCHHRWVNIRDFRHDLPVAENRLVRQFNPGRPNRVWTADITYLPTVVGWVYLAVVLDLYSRKVVGWHICDNMETVLVVEGIGDISQPATAASRSAASLGSG